MSLASVAHADEAPRERVEWVPNKALVTAGGTMMLTGYAPTFALGVPSVVGLVGRIVIDVLTAGTFAVFCGFNSDGRAYLCNGTYGAMQLLVPFAGPFLFAHNHPHDDIIHPGGEPLSPTRMHFLYLSGGLQLGGLAVVLSGLALGHHELVPVKPKRKADGPQFYVLPSLSPTTAGLEATVVGW